MFDKSLTSIYFLESKILVVELDSHKKKVKAFSSIDIPKGLIENYHIKNKEALTETLKVFWAKLGFKQKTVGIVIPEFSTYTKAITLPKLSMGELNEAIAWQAQEYLPSSSEEMITDWKIVGKTEKGFEVLIVAIPKDVLMGYVSICEAAGLFPLGVQTPSLVLTNLTKNIDGGALILYSGFGESVAVVSIKEKILGTSVMTGTEVKNSFDTASKMLSHFKQADVKKIFIGGADISETYSQQLKNYLKSEISVLNPDISGMDAKKIQEFLIPLAMLMGDVKEPSDPKTLNLLPAYLVEKYRIEKNKLQVWSLTLTSTLFVWISFLLVLGSYLVITQQIAALKAKNMQKSHIAAARQKYQTEAKNINETAEKVLKIKGVTMLPEIVLNDIQKSKPSGVSITSYKMDLEKGLIVITGTSTDRGSLVNFRKNLETIPEITAIDIPISSFEKETDLEFTLNFQFGAKPTATPVTKVNQDVIEK